MAKRVVVVVNQWWECDPILDELLRGHARPDFGLGWPQFLNHPHRRPDPNHLPAASWPIPRAIFALTNAAVEIWCVSDLLEHLPDKRPFQSSTERKSEQLPRIFVGQPSDLVVAIGTAAFPGDASQNGSVVVGARVFMHRYHPGDTNRVSKWNQGPFDQVLDSALHPSAFASLTSIPPNEIEPCFLVPPLRPAAHPALLAGHACVALATVNVTDPAEYVQADAETLAVFASAGGCAGSLETTHGLIRVQSEAPFLFVSGIANRVGHYQDDVFPRLHAQNQSAAHNAGVVLARMLPRINEWLSAA